ncbi:unnamed protein product, partial [Scytosiphon promiscuus]
RWVNLWPPASFADNFVPENAPDALDDDDPSGGGAVFGAYSQRGSSASGNLGSAVFVGNLTLFILLLMIIFLIHIAVASAVEAYWLVKKRATEEVARAQLRGLSLREHSRRTSYRQTQRDMGRESSRLPLPNAGTSGDSRGHVDDTDEEGGGTAVTRRRTRMNMKKIAECRERSQSAWLHFPHVELVFLLFAFEGALASQVSAVRENASPLVISLAAGSLLLFPVLMLVMVARTLLTKVRPVDSIVFKLHTEGVGEVGGDPGGTSRGVSGSIRSICAKVYVSLKENHSMFAWADKGHWESVESSDQDHNREANWFLIGFEPIFVDFTKTGSWFVVYSLTEWAALGMVGVLVDNSVTQLSLFCALNTLSFLLLVIFKPFANG